MANNSYKLIIEDDEGYRSTVPVELGDITIGRDESNTIRLNERNVSRNHLRIYEDNNSIITIDLDSFNGVFINGNRIDKRKTLCEGDIITIGDFKLELVGEGLKSTVSETTQKAINIIEPTIEVLNQVLNMITPLIVSKKYYLTSIINL